MSKSLKDRLSGAIGALLRSDRYGRGTQYPQEGPMKNEAITYAVENHYTAVVPGEGREDVASVEAVGQALGYTNIELILTGDVLNRFKWRRPEQYSCRNADSTKTKAADPLCSPEYAA